MGNNFCSTNMPAKKVDEAAETNFNSTRRRLLQGLIASPLASNQLLAAVGGGFDTVVIGAGVFGAWTAWHLTRAGQKVALVDAWGAGNSYSSSGGESRVIRTAYGADAIYSKMAKSSIGQWQALSSRQSQTIFYPSGVLWLSSKRDRYIDESIINLNKLGISHQVLNKQALQQRYRQINMQGINVGFLEHSGGALLARRGVQSVVQEAVKAGCQLVINKAGTPKAISGGVKIPLQDGSSIKADKAVYACGPWLPKVFPRIIGRRILPTRQVVFFFGVPAGDRRFSHQHLPVWADFNQGDIFYGIPDIESRGFKIAHDAHGPEFDPDTREPKGGHRQSEARIRNYLQKRFPDLASAPLLGVRVCQYENSSNGDYLLDQHPELNRVWIAGGGSGHGFKNGPAMGAQVAAAVMGNSDYKAEARFSLAGKSTVHKRAVY